MYVKLTRIGYRVCRNIVATDDAMAASLLLDVRETKSTVTVLAPYATWKHLHGVLYRRTFGPRGGRHQVPKSYFTALQRITKAINYVDSHPAFQGVGMIGWQPDIFPVWCIEPTADGRLYSPYPQPGRQFGILAPVWWHKKGETKLTYWALQPSGEGPLASEQLHLALWRHPVL